MSTTSPCQYCKHYLAAGTCEAFRGKDIPMDIWTGEKRHDKPVTGDNGIQFELADGVPEEMHPYKDGDGNDD